MSKGNKKNTYKGTKAGKGNGKAQAPKKQYIDLYYMNSCELSVKTICDGVLQSRPELEDSIECWEEASVVEFLVGEDSSIDMEMLELSRDELEDEFLSANKIVCAYSVHTDTSQLQEVKAIFEVLVGKCGGMLCSDTADFYPILVK